MATSPLPLQAQDDGCPVPDELIGRLYHADGPGLEALLAPLAARQRAQLALFCYARGHLRRVGYAIAATCDVPVLVEVAGRAGEVLYAQARERPVHDDQPLPLGRRKITLATSVLRTFAALDDDEPDGLPEPAFAEPAFA